MRFAAITSATDNYVPFLNAQLNSLDRLGVRLDFHLVAIDINADYLARAKAAEWSFNLIVHEKHMENLELFYQGKNLQSKKSRYQAMAEIGRSSQYEGMIMLDCDMMIVKDFTPFLDMVAGTNIIVGCNEKFKWNLSRYCMNGKPLKNMSMYWFICNSPLFFDPRHQYIFLKFAYQTASELKEIDGKTPSDLFTMNVALYLSGRQDKVIALPSHCWVGNHVSYFNMTTRIFKRGDRWQSLTGEPVYSIHGRWHKQDSDRSHRNQMKKKYDELELSESVRDRLEKDMDQTMMQIRNEFNYLNTECKLRI